MVKKYKAGIQESISFNKFCEEITGYSLNDLNNEYNKEFKLSKMKKEFKPKVKEHWIKDATIKLITLLETTENPKGSFTNKEIVQNVEISFPWGSTISTSFDTNKKGKDELIKFLRKELYL